MKRKNIWILAACALFMCAGCDNAADNAPSPIAAENVTIEPETLTLVPGETRKLTATVTPENADDKTVTWSSSAENIATVDKNGTVTAAKVGTAVITVTAGGKTATCNVTVKQQKVAVDQITLNKNTLTLVPDTTGKLTATVTPGNADDKTVTWSSSAENIATVDKNGTVTAHAKGTATITATAGGKKATCEITVNETSVNPAPVAVESVTLDKDTLTLTHDAWGKLTATVTPGNADDKSITWSSSDEAIATVYADGSVWARNIGEATITATAGGKTATCNVIVHNHTYSKGKCTVCGVNPSMAYGTINTYGELIKYSGSSSSVVIPDGVTGIGDEVFKGRSDLTSVTIPGSVTYIGISAFYECTSLTSVMIGDGVTYIWDSAFYGCRNLTSVTIPDSVTEIGYRAFEKCTSLTSVTIPDSVTDIGERAFYGCFKLTSVTIPDSVTSIGRNTFEGCQSLTSVTIPSSVTSIGDGAFSKCLDLTSVTIPDNVTSIGRSMFEGCRSLTSVTIPDSVTSIGDGAFSGCTSLASVTIPDSVTSIGNDAFYYCTGLASVKIPASVKSIGSDAFYGCSSLTSVNYDGTEAEWNAIEGTGKDALSGKVTFTK